MESGQDVRPSGNGNGINITNIRKGVSLEERED